MGAMADAIAPRALTASGALAAAVAVMIFGLTHDVRVFFASRMLEGVATAAAVPPLLDPLAAARLHVRLVPAIERGVNEHEIGRIRGRWRQIGQPRDSLGLHAGRAIAVTAGAPPDIEVLTKFERIGVGSGPAGPRLSDLLHLLAAAAPRIHISTSAGFRALCHFDLAATSRVRTAVLVTCLKRGHRVLLSNVRVRITSGHQLDALRRRSERVDFRCRLTYSIASVSAAVMIVHRPRHVGVFRRSHFEISAAS